MLEILTNPVFASILVMMLLCLAKFNVLLSILVSVFVACFFAEIAPSEGIKIFLNGMSGNAETSLSYVLLGIIAAAIANSNLTAILVNKVANLVSDKKYLFIISIAFFSCFSQNLVPIHIAFIPILIPPLLSVMNRLKIDRRAVACALTFALQAPYMVIPYGFGLIFFGVIAKNMTANGMEVGISDISSVMWLAAVPFLLGLAAAIFWFRKERIYENRSVKIEQDISQIKMTAKEYAILAGLLIAFVVQILTESMIFGALSGVLAMIVLQGIKYKDIDFTVNGGLAIMAFIAFVMLVASGFAEVMKATGGVNELVNFCAGFAGNKFGGALMMLIVGLIITMGIGTSFGTVPIIAAIYCPLCVELGFSVAAAILLIGFAGGLGDAGSPASDSTLGPTSGLNADGQHDHIWDTCVPTFVFYNIPLIIFGAIFAVFL